MKAIIDLILVGILILCAWSGYKKGLIMGIGGILVIPVVLLFIFLQKYIVGGLTAGAVKE